MKYASPLIIASFCLGLGLAMASAQSTANSPLDPTQTSERFIPEASVTPEVKDKKTADQLQEKRYRNTRELRGKSTAPAADKRAPIDVTEKQEKNIRDKKQLPVETRTPEKSRYDGQRSRIQTANLFDTSGKVNRFQSYIKDAAPLTKTSEPYIEKRASLDSINRFAFRRNGIPANDSIPITPAGRPIGTPGTASAPDS